MRSLGIAIALLLLGCTALNPSFQDDGSGTSNEDGSASNSGPPTSTSTSTGRPELGTGSSGSSSTSNSSTGGNTSSPGGPKTFEPFRVPITFSPRMETFFNFVARVRIDEAYLIDVPGSSIDF